MLYLFLLLCLTPNVQNHQVDKTYYIPFGICLYDLNE